MNRKKGKAYRQEKKEVYFEESDALKNLKARENTRFNNDIIKLLQSGIDSLKKLSCSTNNSFYSEVGKSFQEQVDTLRQISSKYTKKESIFKELVKVPVVISIVSAGISLFSVYKSDKAVQTSQSYTNLTLPLQYKLFLESDDFTTQIATVKINSNTITGRVKYTYIVSFENNMLDFYYVNPEDMEFTVDYGAPDSNSDTKVLGTEKIYIVQIDYNNNIYIDLYYVLPIPTSIDIETSVEDSRGVKIYNTKQDIFNIEFYPIDSGVLVSEKNYNQRLEEFYEEYAKNNRMKPNTAKELLNLSDFNNIRADIRNIVSYVKKKILFQD